MQFQTDSKKTDDKDTFKWGEGGGGKNGGSSLNRQLIKEVFSLTTRAPRQERDLSSFLSDHIIFLNHIFLLIHAGIIM